MANQNSPLAGKKVMVLGGTSGIGLATAKAAAAEGAQVIVASSNQQRVNEALGELPEGSLGYSVDLGNEGAIKDLFEQIDSFDHLVFTAGESLNIGPVETMDVEQAKAYLNIRFWGAITVVKYAASRINAGGSINLTGGIASRRPGKGWALGASICAAMEGFTRAMAVELAPTRVNLVAPGIVATNLWKSIEETDRQKMYDTYAGMLPVGRIGAAGDIAQAYLYLMKQPFSTGQVIIADGGGVLV